MHAGVVGDQASPVWCALPTRGTGACVVVMKARASKSTREVGGGWREPSVPGDPNVRKSVLTTKPLPTHIEVPQQLHLLSTPHQVHHVNEVAPIERALVPTQNRTLSRLRGINRARKRNWR